MSKINPWTKAPDKFKPPRIIEEIITKYALDSDHFRLGSTKPKKKIPDPECFLVGSKAPHQKKVIIKKKIVGGKAPHQRASRVWEFFLGLVDPSRNRLVSTAYQKKPGFSVLPAQKNKLTDCNRNFTNCLKFSDNLQIA